MSMPCKLLALMVCMLLVNAARAEDRPELRQKFKEWVVANLTTGEAIEQGVINDSDRFIRDGKDVRFLTSAANVRTGNPMGVYTHGGQMFVQTFTPAQARALGLVPGAAELVGLEQVGQSVPLANPIFQISDAKILNADPIKGDQSIKIEFTVKKVGNASYGGLDIRGVQRLRNTSPFVLTPVDKLPNDGKLTVEVPPSKNPEARADFGPVPVFVDLVATGLSPTGSVASNSLMVMVDVQPDQLAMVSSGLTMMRDLIGILASVQDRASAEKAIGDYKRMVLRNKTLADALSRMGPASAEAEKEFADKHGAELESLSQKLQAEFTRIQAAPYAGEAFIDRLDQAAKEAVSEQ